MRKLPTVSEMEHITSKEFGENMDAILERVAKENIALIIDHEDKSYVLCPARWFEGPELTQLEVMLYGHVHNTREWSLVEKWKNEQWTMGIPSRLINVGCMMAYMNYTPRTLDELLEANPQHMIERTRKDGTNAGENSNGEL